MNGFTKAAAFEYGDQGITVNAISPGAVETDLMMAQGPAAAESMGLTYEAFKDGYAQESAIKRLNTVDEVAGLALFLVGEQAGGITGAILPVDGGTVASSCAALTSRRHDRQSDGEHDIGDTHCQYCDCYRCWVSVRSGTFRFLKPSLRALSGQPLCLDPSAWMPKLNEIG